MWWIVWLLLFPGLVLWLAYQRASLATATITLGALLGAWTLAGTGPLWLKIALWALFLPLLLLNLSPLRRWLISRRFLRVYKRMLPPMSDTEREALEAGTVWWDGELFTGGPDWKKLLAMPPPRLSDEEQAFLDGPCEQLCRMIDDWDITHRRADLPPAIWDFIRRQRFWAMIIPKSYGGLGFSAYAHSCVVVKIASRSGTTASTVVVPNSLGPAELLLHYGTTQQKEYYLPRLACGDEIPCFALTGPRVGSDAASMPDTGVVCRGLWQGREVTGIRLNFSKRYITLAPIATLIGLAFRLFDPDRLLGGERTDLGITVALVPRDTPGVTIGRRHFPLNIPFQNGPVRGRDVFVPLEAIIGGPTMAGQGWRMLVELLSVGRCISLPSISTGGCKGAVYSTGAYARIRRQFNMPVGRFEGVEAVIARMAARVYIMDAARSVTTAAIDAGERPSVPSGILKYHVTEMGRRVANDAMDVQGGKGICLGPNNYLGRGYQIVPVGITVEGANILTRSLIIFGQGAVRCHPWVLKEMNAARDPDRRRGVREFDHALFGHIGFTISNAARSFITALTLSRIVRAPVHGPVGRYYEHINRFSASFAFASDVAMLSLGGYLKKKENLSARLGDVLSSLYLASMVLKHHENQGRPEADLSLVEFACRSLLYQAQEQLHGFLRNFPVRWLAFLMRSLIFPRGLTYSAASDQLNPRIAALVMNPGEARERLCKYVYRTLEPGNHLGLVQEALELAVAAEPLEKKIRVDGVKTGRVSALDLPGQIREALAAGVISEAEATLLREYDRKVMAIVDVDDFDPRELGAAPGPTSRPA
ncbi:MAG: acyl-CoA dehydrogenase [Gammaproteobacteria bacterium]|nr:MAG: acyl-CoA dehydrogenase [Gammaproteobacteria bacterium]